MTIHRRPAFDHHHAKADHFHQNEKLMYIGASLVVLATILQGLIR